MVLSAAQAQDELRARGFVGQDPARLDRFLKAGIRRVLGGGQAWPFMLGHVEIAPGAYFGHETVVEVRRADGQRLTHRTRQTLIHSGYDVNQAGQAVFFYLGPSLSAPYGNQVLWTCPVDAGILSVDFYTDPAPLNVAGLLSRLPDSFEDTILDAAELEGAKDAKDWETVQGLRGEVAERIAALVERYADQQISDHGVVVAGLID